MLYSIHSRLAVALADLKSGAAREEGQALIEYALIIGVVSLGSLVALGFMSGKIQGLYSKSGNSLNGIPGVLYAQDNTDITDDIIKILNKNAPPPTPAAAPAAVPAPAAQPEKK